jgi:hypothetical protein
VNDEETIVFKGYVFILKLPLEEMEGYFSYRICNFCLCDFTLKLLETNFLDPAFKFLL